MLVLNLKEFFCFGTGKFKGKSFVLENVKNSKSKTTSVEFYAGFPGEQFLETKIIASMQPISHFHWHFSFFS